MGKKRGRMSRGASKKAFRKTSGAHPKNGMGGSGGVYAMRGGIRL